MARLNSPCNVPAARASIVFKNLADNSRVLDLQYRYETGYDRQYCRATPSSSSSAQNPTRSSKTRTSRPRNSPPPPRHGREPRNRLQTKPQHLAQTPNKSQPWSPANQSRTRKKFGKRIGTNSQADPSPRGRMYPLKPLKPRSLPPHHTFCETDPIFSAPHPPPARLKQKTMARKSPKTTCATPDVCEPARKKTIW